MTFTVGETVVYPNHGAAIIEDIEMRTIKGEDREYLVLHLALPVAAEQIQTAEPAQPGELRPHCLQQVAGIGLGGGRRSVASPDAQDHRMRLLTSSACRTCVAR